MQNSKSHGHYYCAFSSRGKVKYFPSITLQEFIADNSQFSIFNSIIGLMIHVCQDYRIQTLHRRKIALLQLSRLSYETSVPERSTAAAFCMKSKQLHVSASPDDHCYP